MSRLLAVAAVVAASFAIASPSSAVVGGRDAAPGAYPAVAEIRFGSSFLCTGTLIAPVQRQLGSSCKVAAIPPRCAQ